MGKLAFLGGSRPPDTPAFLGGLRPPDPPGPAPPAPLGGGGLRPPPPSPILGTPVGAGGARSGGSGGREPPRKAKFLKLSYQSIPRAVSPVTIATQS